MKKLLFFVAGIMMLTACGDQAGKNSQLAQNDSLQNIIAARDNEINDLMGTLNEIQQGFQEINEAEERVTIAKSGEGADKAVQIRENIQFIAQRMAENRELIAKLRQQLREVGFKGDQLQKTIENLTAQMALKDRQLQALRAELDQKNIHIAELDQTITGLNKDVENLNKDVTDLKTENTEKAQTISSQDKQLNTAWFVYGTKSELKNQGIISGGKVLQGNFNKKYFTKIDILTDKEIKLYSKSAKILTSHSSSSYTLEKDTKGQYVLRITDPQTFWSTSKYLVVQVK